MRNLVRLDERTLLASGVVANCCMNRERDLNGSNGYQKEIGLDPIAVLTAAAKQRGFARWLDLCCGAGKALIQAASIAESQKLPIEIVGVDLVNTFMPHQHPSLQLMACSLFNWAPTSKIDLITCVHGLHYIGDKLQAIVNALTWLSESGILIANIDLTSIHFDDAAIQGQKQLAKFLRESKIKYDSRKKLVRWSGPRELKIPFTYLGADDQAGPNYTRQPAVNSHYALR